MGESFRSPAKIARRLKLFPLVFGQISNWATFMRNYALGLVPSGSYDFRNGARIKIGRGVDHVPIIEIFLRRDYGTLPNDAVILDLGANIGVFAIYAATTARNVRIYAYEPLPEFYELMRENVRLNKHTDTVECFNYAVCGEATTRDIYVAGTDFFFPTFVSPSNGDEKATRLKVHCTTLAEILDANQLEHVDLLKMDIEGAEYEVFCQTPPRYFERIKEIRMEYHNLDTKERNVARLKDFLSNHGYHITREQINTPTNGNLWARRKNS
jgi:FkbM family methyltransferase